MSSSSIYDLVVRAALQAKVDNMKGSQVAKLLELVWSFDEKTLYEDLVLYMARQVARRDFSFGAAKYLVEGFDLLKKENRFDRENVAKFIGLFRWAFDTVEKSNIRVNPRDIPNIRFNDFLRIIRFKS